MSRFADFIKSKTFLIHVSFKIFYTYTNVKRKIKEKKWKPGHLFLPVREYFYL